MHNNSNNNNSNNNAAKTCIGSPISQSMAGISKISTLFIEISGMCTARCPYCARHNFKERYSGENMSPVLFEQVLTRLFELGIVDRANPPVASFYNWGEPSLNPGINSILRVLVEKKISADISSNFIVKPDIEDENLPVIRSMKFSLSGFTQDSYGRIHGASLAKVLKNFDDFYVQARKHSPKTSIIVAWHRYVFNEGELWDAYRYFNRPGIQFLPTIAYFNDHFVMKDFLKRRLSEDSLKHAEPDLFLDHIRKGVDYCATISKDYRCPAWNSLVIDETGQMLLCCGVTRFDSDYVLGNILEMSATEILKDKSRNKLCGECLSSGLAPWAYNQILYNEMPLPPGGGVYHHFRLWSQCNPLPIKVSKVLMLLPNGEMLIRMLKQFKRFVATV